jgi:hypothetical protein
MYWISGSTQNFATVGAWSNTQGGGSNATTPGAGDVAVFTGSSSGTCTIAANTPALLSFDCNGGTTPFTGTIQHNAFSIIIGTGGGVFRLVSGMTYAVSALTSVVSFTHTSGSCSLTSAGQKFAAITVNGAGGTVLQKDDLAFSPAIQNATLTITAGTYDWSDGGANHTLTVPILSSSNSNTRTVTCGGLLKIGGNTASAQTPLSFGNGTGLTFTKGTCNIEVLAPTTTVNQLTLAMSGIVPAALNNLTFDNLTQNVGLSFSGSAAFTFSNLSIGAGWILYPSSNLNVTVSNPFNWVGTPQNPVGYIGSSVGASGTLTCSGASTVNWGVLGVIGAGGGTFTATNTLFVGSSTGWSVTYPADSSSTGIVSALWTDLLSSADFSTAGSVGALIRAMSNLQFSVPAIGRGTCTSGGSTTSVPSSAFTPAGAVANQFVNRVIVFDANTTTAALQGQAAVISASTNAANPVFTVPGLTTAPATGDKFSVV